MAVESTSSQVVAQRQLSVEITRGISPKPACVVSGSHVVGNFGTTARRSSLKGCVASELAEACSFLVNGNLWQQNEGMKAIVRVADKLSPAQMWEALTALSAAAERNGEGGNDALMTRIYAIKKVAEYYDNGRISRYEFLAREKTVISAVIRLANAEGSENPHIVDNAKAALIEMDSPIARVIIAELVAAAAQKPNSEKSA